MAIAETVYADPSALLRLYVHHADSRMMSAWRVRAKGALPITHHGRVEIVNGICLAAFRGYISQEAMGDALASFEEDIAEGRYAETNLLWRATLKRAARLSREHTAEIGCRSLDVLHVASALELEFKRFLTFDDRQRQLAHAVGLKLVSLPAK